MVISKSRTLFKCAVTALVMASLLCAPSMATRRAQNRERTVHPRNESAAQVAEPVMRIALATDTRAATISTTAQLLNASELLTEPLRLEVSRVRVESRLLAPSPPVPENIELTIARALDRDDADRLVDSIRDLVEEEAKAVADTDGKWRVIVMKQAIEDAQAAVEKLESSGFEARITSPSPSGEARISDGRTSASSGTVSTNVNPDQFPSAKVTPKTSSAAVSNSSGLNRVKLTSRASAPNREVVAFASGLAPLRSSAPMTFASSDKANAPVRFNDRPYRGQIEVFANRRGSLTVVNVIGLEDYVRGVEI